MKLTFELRKNAEFYLMSLIDHFKIEADQIINDAIVFIALHYSTENNCIIFHNGTCIGEEK